MNGAGRKRRLRGECLAQQRLERRAAAVPPLPRRRHGQQRQQLPRRKKRRGRRSGRFARRIGVARAEAGEQRPLGRRLIRLRIPGERAGNLRRHADRRRRRRQRRDEAEAGGGGRVGRRRDLPGEGGRTRSAVADLRRLEQPVAQLPHGVGDGMGGANALDQRRQRQPPQAVELTAGIEQLEQAALAERELLGVERRHPLLRCHRGIERLETAGQALQARIGPRDRLRQQPAAVVEGVKIFGYYNAGQDCTAACRRYALGVRPVIALNDLLNGPSEPNPQSIAMDRIG